MADINNSKSDLAFRFARQLRDARFLLWLSLNGYVSGQEVIVVSRDTVIDMEILRRRGEQVIREAPGTEHGWELLV
jgi:hypothetical protein